MDAVRLEGAWRLWDSQFSDERASIVAWLRSEYEKDPNEWASAGFYADAIGNRKDKK